MLLTERRFPAASDAPPAAARHHRDGGSQFPARPQNIDREIQRCRGMVQASKAERLYQSSPDSRRGL